MPDGLCRDGAPPQSGPSTLLRRWRDNTERRREAAAETFEHHKAVFEGLCREWRPPRWGARKSLQRCGNHHSLVPEGLCRDEGHQKKSLVGLCRDGGLHQEGARRSPQRWVATPRGCPEASAEMGSHHKRVPRGLCRDLRAPFYGALLIVLSAPPPIKGSYDISGLSFRPPRPLGRACARRSSDGPTMPSRVSCNARRGNAAVRRGRSQCRRYDTTPGLRQEE